MRRLNKSAFEVYEGIYFQGGKKFFNDLRVKMENHFIFKKLSYIILLLSEKRLFQ